MHRHGLEAAVAHLPAYPRLPALDASDPPSAHQQSRPGRYALDARLLRKTFWTLSAWTGRPELAKFNGSDPHHAAVKAIRSRMQPTTFVTWTSRAGDLPVAWDEARERILQADRTPVTRAGRR